MRYVWTLLAAGVFSVLVLLPQTRSAYALFHCMRIHAVGVGFSGNSTMQYVELRMDAATQNFVSGHQIKFYDGTGTLKATFTFPGNVTNGSTGDSILVATKEFNDNSAGGDADFVFSDGSPGYPAANTVGANGGDPLHPVQSPEGRVTFAEGIDNCDVGTTISPGEVDSLTYNDQSMGDLGAHFGTPAVPLLSPGNNKGLRLGNLNQTPADNNSEYSLLFPSTTTFSVAMGNLATDFSFPRNNSRVVLQLTAPVGGIARLPEVAREGAGIDAQPGGSPWSAGTIAALAGGLSVAALATGAWYARRRWSNRG